MIFHVVAHITLLLILAFFVLFAAGKAEGLVKVLGTILGAWLILVAAVVIVAVVTRPMFGGKPFGLDGMHAWHDGWQHHGWMHPEGQPAQPAPATPAKPAGH